jgi:hypothetical protein
VTPWYSTGSSIDLSFHRCISLKTKPAIQDEEVAELGKVASRTHSSVLECVGVAIVESRFVFLSCLIRQRKH